MCVLTSLVKMIFWCNCMVQHRIVHGSFTEPLRNADTDVSILQTMHVKHFLRNTVRFGKLETFETCCQLFQCGDDLHDNWSHALQSVWCMGHKKWCLKPGQISHLSYNCVARSPLRGAKWTITCNSHRYINIYKQIFSPSCCRSFHWLLTEQKSGRCPWHLGSYVFQCRNQSDQSILDRLNASGRSTSFQVNQVNPQTQRNTWQVVLGPGLRNWSSCHGCLGFRSRTLLPGRVRKANIPLAQNDNRNIRIYTYINIYLHVLIYTIVYIYIDAKYLCETSFNQEY